jgi:FAD/FMN-containing dehydrogenase
MDTFGAIGPADLVRVAGDPEAPVPARGAGLLLRELTPEVVAAFAEAVEEHDALTVMEIRQLGGALAREGVDAPFQFFAGGTADSDASRAATEAALDAVQERMAPWAAPRLPLPSVGVGADVARGYPDGVWERLRAIRAAVDPDGLFLAHHDE